MKPKIKTEVVAISPEMAAVMLEKNHSNRPVRETNVNRFAVMMKAGEWLTTHQGIAFDTEGRLVDGQHRLMAIMKADITVEMMVSRGLTPEAFAVLDQGAKRSAADILHCSPAIAEVINFATRVASGNTMPSPQQLQATHRAFIGYAEKIQGACGIKTVYFSSAPMRLAAIVRIIQGEDEAFVLNKYRQLCRAEMQDLDNSGQALMRLRVHSKVSATNKNQVLANGLYVFDKERSTSTKIRSLEPQAAVDLVRAVLRPLYEACL